MFTDFNGLEIFFLICAIIGGIFFVIKLIFQFIGSEIDVTNGVDSNINFDVGHTGSDVGFHVLSMFGLSAFFMMFGLVGLALYRQSQVGTVISIIGAVAAGIFSVWVISKLFCWAAHLQSSGTLNIVDAVGCTGTVYLTIPKGGTGRVSLNFKNCLRELDASEVNGNEVPSGIPVRVVKVNANILIVEIIK